MGLKMRSEVLDEVIKRLRSGEYKQGQSALRVKGDETNPDMFCCLGIICEMAVEEGVVVLRDAPQVGAMYEYVSPDGTADTAYLPVPVIKWAGIVSDIMKNSSFEEYHYEMRGHFDDTNFSALSVMNDSGEHDFLAIADWMERNVVRV